MGRGVTSVLLIVSGCGFSANKGVGGSDASDAPAIDGPIDAPGDGPLTDGPPADMPTDAPMLTCTPGAPVDAFQGSIPCSPWATFDSSDGAQTTQSGGKLRVAAPAAALGSSHGGCFATGLSAFGPQGVFIQVERALVGGNAYTAFTAYVSLGSTAASIRLRNGTIDVHNPSTSAVAGSATYVETQMQYWRLRPVSNGVVGEVSADALTWQILGTVMGAPPTMVRLDISAGTTAIEAGAGTAIFDNLNVCP